MHGSKIRQIRLETCADVSNVFSGYKQKSIRKEWKLTAKTNIYCINAHLDRNSTTTNPALLTYIFTKHVRLKLYIFAPVSTNWKLVWHVLSSANVKYDQLFLTTTLVCRANKSLNFFLPGFADAQTIYSEQTVYLLLEAIDVHCSGSSSIQQRMTSLSAAFWTCQQRWKLQQ